jgi:hypothetical protein
MGVAHSQGSECPNQERCHAPVPGVPGGPPGGDAVPGAGVRRGPARARPRRHDSAARRSADGPQLGDRVAGELGSGWARAREGAEPACGPGGTWRGLAHSLGPFPRPFSSR